MKLLKENGSKGLFRCTCGTEKWINKYAVADGRTKSCGCLKSKLLRSKNTVHGMHKSSEYNSWQSMLNRCYNPKCSKFNRYGGRGITVCARWKKSFLAFISDMGCKPTVKHSLDRKDYNKGYTPSNCRWATTSEQARNKSTNMVIAAFGKSMTLQAWAEETGIDRRKISDRIKLYGWTPEKALCK